jgi:hypothetical protein
MVACQYRPTEKEITVILVLTVNQSRPGVYNTDQLMHLDGLEIEASGFGDRAIFNTLRGRIPALSTHPYTGGVDIRSYGRTVGTLKPAGIDLPPAILAAVVPQRSRQDHEVFLAR